MSWGSEQCYVDKRALTHEQAALFEQRIDFCEHGLRLRVLFQQVTEVHECDAVRHAGHGKVNTAEMTQRLAVVNRIFDGNISQPVLLLNKVHAQHAFDPDGRATTIAALRIMGLNDGNESAPGHDLLHLGEKEITPGELFIGVVFGLGETGLLKRHGSFAHESAQIIVMVY